MQFSRYEIDVGEAAVVVVKLDRAANVRLMDRTNFQRFRAGRSHEYIGGEAKTSRLRVPHAGRWFLTIDHGPRGGSIRSSISVLLG